MKKALICGISGQDGAYLAKYLLRKSYEVYGTSRDAELNPFTNLLKLEIKDKVKLSSMSINDFRNVLQTIERIEPDEIYNLAGQSSVSLSFDQPIETFDSIARGTLNLLESIRYLNLKIKFYNASSSECFGNSEVPADEKSSFYPLSPYAVAKSSSYWTVVNYRNSYDIFACSGILFNHESPLRPSRFVTRKIIDTAIRISRGSQEKLKLGNLHIERDWGWAPEYVEAMYSILQYKCPEDFVVATGSSYTLEEFVSCVFSKLDLDWKEHIEIDDNLFRPSDMEFSKSNPSKAEKILGWKAQYKMPDVVKMMIEELE